MLQVDALRDASPSALTFTTGVFSPAARKLAFTTSRHVQVKRRLLVKPVPLGLELSDDLLDLIAKCLLRMQASAGIYARCSKAFKGAVARAASLLEVDEHIFYWTGSSPPMKPPLIELLSPGQKMQEWSAAFTSRDLHAFVHGSGLEDSVLRHCHCCNRVR